MMLSSQTTKTGQYLLYFKTAGFQIGLVPFEVGAGGRGRVISVQVLINHIYQPSEQMYKEPS